MLSYMFAMQALACLCQGPLPPLIASSLLLHKPMHGQTWFPLGWVVDSHVARFLRSWSGSPYQYLRSPPQAVASSSDFSSNLNSSSLSISLFNFDRNSTT